MLSNGPSFINVELTSRCNKSCWMCGRRKMEREHPELCNWGDMSYEMVQKIEKQVASETVVQFHNNGEPLLYRDLGRALSDFRGRIRCLNTNGILLMARADELIDNLETLTISVIEDDQEGEEQYETVCQFIEQKGDKPPFLIYRLLGKVDDLRWKALPGVVARRVLHSPDGSRDYRKPPTVPEIGICLDLLTHLAIDRFGNINLCVRFFPSQGDLKIGDIKEITIEEAWNSAKRRAYLEYHIEQRRGELPGCQRCEYWGCPRGE